MADTTDESSLDIDRLARLKAKVDATRQLPIEASSAPALTEGYMRLRGEARAVVAGTPLESELGDTAFPDVEPFQGMLTSVRGKAEGDAAAARAAGLLAQLAAWMHEVIAAEQRARQEWAS